MTHRAPPLPLLLLAIFTTACGSAIPVDMDEPRRIVGTESSVRIDAQVIGEEARPGAQIPVTYEITNMRPTPIAIAELVPETAYDVDTHTFTVTIGAEVPGHQLLPRLVEIAPGERKTFTAIARFRFILPRVLDPMKSSEPAAFRLKLNFLGDTAPFQQLIGIKENAINDPQLADTLFGPWIERNEVVYTNTIPMRLLGRAREVGVGEQPQQPGRRRRGGM